MKRIAIIVNSDGVSLHDTYTKNIKLVSKLHKKGYEVKSFIYDSNETDTENIQTIKIHQTSKFDSRILIHALHADWPADYFAYINYGNNPKEQELMRVLELVTSKFADIAYSSSLIGKTRYVERSLISRIFNILVTVYYNHLNHLDTKSSMVVFSQSAALAIRDQITKVENDVIITELLTKSDHFGLRIYAAPTTNLSKLTVTPATLWKNLVLAFTNRNWKPNRRLTSLSISRVQKLLTD